MSNIYKTSLLSDEMSKKRSAEGGNYTNNSGVAAVVLGILSILFGISIFLGSFAGVILAIISLVFALRQRKVHSNIWSTWGVILSIAGLAINLAIIIILIQFARNQIIPIIEQAAQQAQQMQYVQP